MSISKNKKRITVTLHNRVIECLNEIIDAGDEKLHTYSEIVNLAVVYFYLTLNGAVDNELKEKK